MGVKVDVMLIFVLLFVEVVVDLGVVNVLVYLGEFNEYLMCNDFYKGDGFVGIVVVKFVGFFFD